MIFKVVTVISLLKVCVADVPTRLLHPQSNQAISSQSFVRHDVPLSYQYSWVHVYTTPKSEQEYQHKPLVTPSQPLVRQQPPQIQYAPILADHAYQYNSPNAINELQVKTHLEPKPSEHLSKMSNPEDIHHHEHLSYVPGYNIEVLQSVHKYPGHNAVYRSNPNLSSSEKLNKINFLNQYVRPQNKDEELKTSTPVPQHDEPHAPVQHPIEHLPETFQRGQLYPPLLIPSGPLQHPHNVLMVPSGPQQLTNVQEYAPHPKAHKMLLNTAHKYNIAQAMAKAQHSLTIKSPSHTQAFIQLRSPAEPVKTLLSVLNKKIYSPKHPAQ